MQMVLKLLSMGHFWKASHMVAAEAHQALTLMNFPQTNAIFFICLTEIGFEGWLAGAGTATCVFLKCKGSCALFNH